LRAACAVAFGVISLVAIWTSGAVGIASLLSNYALASNQLPVATDAVKFGATNPDIVLVRAALLEANADQAAAVSEYEHATRLRPDDFVLWLALARAYEMSSDSARAILAARQAVVLAPYYSEPHWQLGNILIRAGRQDEGFLELSVAAKSDPAMMPGIVDLAWHLLNGDPQAVQHAIQPQDSESYQALATYFRQHDAIADAIAMYKAAGSSAQAGVNSYVAELISRQKYPEAYSLWSFNRTSRSKAEMADAGFEEDTDLKEPGFGWRSADPNPQSCRFTLDPANPREGALSLRVEFSGDSNPAIPVISQLLLVEPQTRYELQFSARTEALVTAGLPVLTIMDANNNAVLGKGDQLPRTTGWRDFVVDFTTTPSTTAIQVALRREDCLMPCPIFGRVWLDRFSLRKL
jgi:tetratricopeptide (TPR) repeat protein